MNWWLAGVDWQGLPSPHYGGYQFKLSTWWSVGGRGLPSDWSVREQTYRAWLNWRANGRRWGGSQWPQSSRACGLL